MLKDAFLTKISTLLKIDVTKLKAAIANEKEEDVELADDLTVFNKVELDTLKRNTYDPAKKAGEEMLIKDLKKKHGLDFTGEDPEKFVEAIQKKVKAELDTNPDARIVELTKTVEATKKLLGKANETADNYKNQMESYKTDTSLLAMLPKNRSEVMTNDEFLSLVKSNIKIETRDGKQVALKNGEIVVDQKTAEPIAPQKVIEDYFAERKGWLVEKDPVPPKGRGGNNSVIGGAIGKFTKMSELETSLKADGLNVNGEEYTKRVQAAIKENPDMDMRS